MYKRQTGRVGVGGCRMRTRALSSWTIACLSASRRLLLPPLAGLRSSGLANGLLNVKPVFCTAQRQQHRRLEYTQC